MGSPSFAPDPWALSEFEDDVPTVIPPRPGALRLSRMPGPHASVTALLPRVEETFRRMNTEPPGPAHNDASAAPGEGDGEADEELSEDELFAIWVAHLT